jgi:hypothetical protein
MTTNRIRRWLTGGAQVALAFLWASTATAQTFSSGSTGLDGPFAPTASTTLALPPNGVFNFTTVNIPAGVTVAVTPNGANTPVTLLATGDVTIAGTLSVSGANGVGGANSITPARGGAGGPGGFAGGNGGTLGGSIPSAGQGPGGGSPGISSANTFPQGATYGAPASFVSLLPLFGGSGGGGSSAFPSFSAQGASGGGGGGAIVIASSTRIVVSGSVTANGGTGGFCGTATAAAGGSGGAIRLVAPQITGSGTLQAKGGASNCANGGDGRTRVEAFTLGFTGIADPPGSASAAPGPVTTASNPALASLPTLTFSSIGGVAAPASPGGSYTTADVSLPQGTTNPVPVTLTASNIPVGTVFTVKLIPQAGDATTVSIGPSTGTFTSSTATANVTFPSGQVSVLNASASFTLPAQVAGLYPLIDGEPVERVMVAAGYGEPSTVTLITRSGKEVPAEQVFQRVR